MSSPPPSPSPLSISPPLYSHILSVLENEGEKPEENRVRISSTPPSPLAQSSTSIMPSIRLPSSRSPSLPIPSIPPSSSSSSPSSSPPLTLTPLHSEARLEMLERRVEDLKKNRDNLIYSAQTYEKIIAKKFERNGPMWTVPAYNKFLSEVEKYRIEHRRSMEEVDRELKMLERHIEMMSHPADTDTQSEDVANFVQEFNRQSAIILMWMMYQQKAECSDISTVMSPQFDLFFRHFSIPSNFFQAEIKDHPLSNQTLLANSQLTILSNQREVEETTPVINGHDLVN